MNNTCLRTAESFREVYCLLRSLVSLKKFLAVKKINGKYMNGTANRNSFSSASFISSALEIPNIQTNAKINTTKVSNTTFRVLKANSLILISGVLFRNSSDWLLPNSFSIMRIYTRVAKLFKWFKSRLPVKNLDKEI